MKKLQTKYVTNKIYHIVQDKLLQTKKVLQTKRRCKLKTSLRYKFKKTSLRSNVHMWCCKHKSSAANIKVVLQTKKDLQTEKKME